MLFWKGRDIGLLAAKILKSLYVSPHCSCSLGWAHVMSTEEAHRYSVNRWDQVKMLYNCVVRRTAIKLIMNSCSMSLRALSCWIDGTTLNYQEEIYIYHLHINTLQVWHLTTSLYNGEQVERSFAEPKPKI